MILLFVLAFSASLCGVINAQSGCPFFQKELKDGQSQLELMNQAKARLVANGFVTGPTEPGSILWGSSALSAEVADNFFKTDSLLIAQQFYTNQKNASFDGLTSTQKQALLSELTEFVPLSDRCAPVPECKKGYKYTEIDGRCNNLENPKLGQNMSPLSRLLPPNYDDDIFTIRKSVTNAQLPSTRVVGNDVVMKPGHIFKPFTEMNFGAVIFGQYIAHDTGNKKIYQSEKGGAGLRCCSKDYTKFVSDSLSYYGCLATEVPSNDPFVSQYGMSCLNFLRAQPVLPNDCKVGPAQPSNEVTHGGLDNSVIYGSNSNVGNAVRAFTSGKLALEPIHKVMAKRPGCTGGFCYFTGDGRASGFPPLAIWHSIFIRMHNNVAEQLSADNKNWNDEILFQEARRIVTAVYHNIVYNEWLPLLIGKSYTDRSDLNCGKQSTYCGKYDPSVDPSTTVEYTNAALRVLHINLPKEVNLYNAKYQKISTTNIHDMFTGSSILETNYNDVMRGNILDPAEYGDYPEHLRTSVFKGANPNGLGVDLLAVDIERGRDTGLDSYHVYLDLAVPGGYKVTEWNDLHIVFSWKNIDKLKAVYKSPLDIDLMVGCFMEEKKFAYVGLVTKYILIEQFYRYKFGDRFFYSLENGANPFTAEQIGEINQQTFASVLCSNSDIEEMTTRAFETKSWTNRLAKCSSFRPLNLKLWQVNAKN